MLLYDTIINAIRRKQTLRLVVLLFLLQGSRLDLCGPLVWKLYMRRKSS